MGLFGLLTTGCSSSEETIDRLRLDESVIVGKKTVSFCEDEALKSGFKVS